MNGYIQSVRNSRDNVLLLDSGNFFYGSLFFTTFRGEAHARYFSEMKYDAWSLGTNDLFFGSQFFQTYINDLDATMPSPISCNVDVSSDPHLSKNRTARPSVPLLSGWSVVERGGREIGIIGAITARASTTAVASNSNIYINKNATAEQYIRLARYAIAANHPNCSIFILLGTLEEEEMLTVARRVQGLHIIVWGQQILFANRESLEDYEINSPYPMRLINDYGEEVLVVSSYQYSSYIGDLQVSFDDDGELVSVDPASDSIEVHASVANMGAVDGVLWTEIQRDLIVVEEQNRLVVGKTEVLLYGDPGTPTRTEGCRWGECNMGELITRAFLYFCDDCDIAFMNGGGIRASINPATLHDGNVTRGDVLRVMPFQNSLATFHAKGVMLIDFVRQAVSSRGLGAFMQMRGIRVAYNPHFSTVAAVQVWNKGTQSFEAIKNEFYYKVALPDFVANGGDGYEQVIRANPPVNRNMMLPSTAEVTERYLSSLSLRPVTVSTTEDLSKCNNQTYLIGEEDGVTIWPNDCHLLMSTGSEDVLKKCVTNRNICPLDGRVTEVYPGRFPNASGCAACSGLGECNARVCTCYGPEEFGLFKDIQMISGEDCSVIREEKVAPSALVAVMWLTCIILIVFSIVYIAAIQYYRKHQVIYRSQTSFLTMIGVGALLAGVSSVLMIPQRTTALCLSSLWLFNLGFVVAYGALFIKTYRIYRIFCNKQLRIVRISFRKLLMLLGGMIGIEALMTVLHTSVAMPKLQAMASGNTEYILHCTSDLHSTFISIELLYKGLLLLWGAFLAWEIRNINSNYNESKYLAAVIYNASFTALVVIPLKFLSGSGLGDPMGEALQVVGINYCFIVVLVAMAGPKLIAIHYGSENTSSTSGFDLTRGDPLQDADTPNALIHIIRSHLKHATQHKDPLVRSERLRKYALVLRDEAQHAAEFAGLAGQGSTLNLGLSHQGSVNRLTSPSASVCNPPSAESVMIAPSPALDAPATATAPVRRGVMKTAAPPVASLSLASAAQQSQQSEMKVEVGDVEVNVSGGEGEVRRSVRFDNSTQNEA